MLCTLHSQVILLHHVVAAWFGHAIEVGGRSHGVGPHVLKLQPISLLQLREGPLLLYTVKTITRGAPDTAAEAWLTDIGLA